ncbi:hypothetical protein FRC08_007532 [Ceratobasidium sp. 394]|nr:hypothetical protein FRC08_007532 [Ceratobasidium sp. 394]
MPLHFPRVFQFPAWLIYAWKPVLLAFQLIVLGLFWVNLLESAQPCVFIEDELESSIVISKAARHRSVDALESISQKLRSLAEVLPLVQWKQWPWDHIYQPIKRHTLELLAKEKSVLQVSFPNNSNQAITVSKFQEHLLQRIRDHARRVESFWLGSATDIQGEMEDRISQVWASIRAPDIDTSDAPLPPLHHGKNEGFPMHPDYFTGLLSQPHNNNWMQVHDEEAFQAAYKELSREVQDYLELRKSMRCERIQNAKGQPDKVALSNSGRCLLRKVRSLKQISLALWDAIGRHRARCIEHEDQHQMIVLMESMLWREKSFEDMSYEEPAPLMFEDEIGRTMVDRTPMFGESGIQSVNGLMKRCHEFLWQQFDDASRFSFTSSNN